jgi:hypothetical protein
MRALLSLLLLALLGAAAIVPVLAAEPVLVVAPEPAADPWWLRAQWQPRATAARGVPVKRLHPEWCAVEAFSRELIGEALLGPAAGHPLAGLAFALDGTFDGSGRAQTAFVGAYRRCAGEQGLFVAIVEPWRDRPRVRFLVEVPNAGSALAAVGRDPDGTLVAWWCAACDNGVRIEFNRETKGFFVAGPAQRRP